MSKMTLLCALLLFSIFPALQAQPYRNLVLKGGGIRGIAYCGTLQVLEEKHVVDGIEKVGGTSVGALVGALLSVGYSADSITNIMFGLEIKSFNDGEWFFIGGQRRLRKKFGWYKGNRLEEWLGQAIQSKVGNADITFNQLHQLTLKDRSYKDLYVTATNLTRQRLEVFSWETYPDMAIRTAVRASISVPVYYEAVVLDSAGHKVSPNDSARYSVFVDGGVMANYPVTMFNTSSDSGINALTLGIKLERSAQMNQSVIAPFQIRQLKDYIGALYNLILEQQAKVSREKEQHNTIYVSNCDMGPRVRHITAEQKMKLVKSGRDGALLFFEGR